MKVAFLPSVLDDLESLIFILYKEEYFGFLESARSYVDLMIDTIESTIELKPGKKAPEAFKRFGQNLLYITYQPNKRTTWYIFYTVHDDRYLIRHITNNHVTGHFF